MITGPQHWAAPALTAYLSLMVATGYGMAGWRRWGRAGQTTLLGAFLWGAAGLFAEGYVRVAALAVGPIVLAFGAVEWRRRRGPAEAAARRDAFGWLVGTALGAGALLVFALQAFSLKGEGLHAAGAAAVALPLLTALALRRGLVPPMLQLLVYGLAVAPVVLFPTRQGGIPPAWELWAAALASALAGASLIAAWTAPTRETRAMAGAGAVAALVVSLFLQGPPTAAVPWLPTLVAAVLLAGGAALLARRSEEPARDIAVALWLWSSATALAQALRIMLDPEWLAAALGAAAVGYAVLHVRLGWRGFAASSIGVSLAAVGALVAPGAGGELLELHLSPLVYAASAALAAALAYAADWIVRRGKPDDPTAGALSTAALLIGLTGPFMLLRWWGSGSVGDRLDPFLEASYRTILLLAAGYSSQLTARADSHWLSRWRGHALMLTGLAHAIMFQAIAVNPLVAWWGRAVGGPPLLDSLALGFLIPAVLLAAATRAKVSPERPLLRIYGAGAAALALAWTLMETRRLYQGPSLQAGFDGIGRAEAAAYAVILLLFARGIFEAARRAARGGWTVTPVASEVARVAHVFAWAALAVALGVFAVGASPWWGPIDRPLAGHDHAALLFGLYAAGAAATFWLRPTADGAGHPLLARAARIETVVIGFALLTLLVRYAFHGLDMRPTLQEASLETWAFSAAWGLFGFGLLVLASWRKQDDLRWAGLVVLLGTTAKVFLFDMARLEGVVRAGSFLAVGALLLAAAVIARRLSGAAVIPGLGRRPD